MNDRSAPTAARLPGEPRHWSLAVLLIGLVAGVAVGWLQWISNEARVQAQLQAATGQVSARLRERMHSYEYALYATRGAVRVAGTSAEALTREAFRRFTGSFDLRERFPGASGVGFVRRTLREQDDAFMAEMRHKGEPSFRIRELQPDGLDAPERFLLMFMEPPSPDWQDVEGLDLATEIRRRVCVRASMGSGEPRLSAPLTLLLPGTPEGHGFVLSLPIYTHGGTLTRAQREAATYGWAVMLLVANDVLADFDAQFSTLALSLSDLKPWNPPDRFYTSTGWQSRGNLPAQRVQLAVFGREWLLEVQARPAFLRQLQLLSPAVAGLGVAMAFAVLALLLHGMLRAAERQRQEEALRRRTEQAEAANRAKSAFLAHMSHEIRTPLNAVIGLSQLLQRMPLEERQGLYVQHIANAGTHLLALVNDVLDLSKIEAGEMRLEEQPFETRPLLQALHAQAEAQATGKPLRVQLEIDPELPAWLRGDALRLRQVLSNLLGNAVKFTAEGQVTLRARLLERQGPRARLRLDVSDTGIGISAEQQQAVFEPFTQADASTTRRFGGTGLGLSIVARLVAMMGGEVALQSVPGQGSTFSITLALEEADPAA